MRLPASRGQLREAVQGQPPPALELIKPGEARGKHTSVWWKQTDLLLGWAMQGDQRGGTFIGFQEAGCMVPWWLPATEHWPVGSKPGAFPPAPPPSNRTRESGPGLEMLWSQVSGWSQRGSLFAAEKPTQTYQEMHRIHQEACAHKTGWNTQTFRETNNFSWLLDIKLEQSRQPRWLVTCPLNIHTRCVHPQCIWMKHIHTPSKRKCLCTNADVYRGSQLHWFEFRWPEFQYQPYHKSVQLWASDKPFWICFLICEMEPSWVN